MDNNQNDARTVTTDNEEVLMGYFLKNPKLLRSPKMPASSNTSQIQKRPRDNEQESPEGYDTKKPKEDPYERLRKLLESSSKATMDKLNSIETELGQLRTDLTSRVIKIEDKVVTLEADMSKLKQENDKSFKKDQERNRKLIHNAIQQQMLECCMEIQGIKMELIDCCTDLKKLALNTIKSFQIVVKETDIKEVAVKEIAYDEVIKKILSVTFANKTIKTRIMKEKKKIQETNGIYFNISMSQTNEYFMRKSKQLAKPKKLRVVFYDGAVRAKKLDGGEIIITDEESLQELANYITSLEANTSFQ